MIVELALVLALAAPEAADRYSGFQAYRGPVPSGARVVARTFDGGIFVVAEGAAAPGAIALKGTGPWPSGRVFVEVREGAADVFRKAGLRDARQTVDGKWWVADAGVGGESAAIRSLLDDDRVLRVGEDRVRRFAIHSPFDDELFGVQWHLENTGQRQDLFARMTAGSDINIRGAWSRTFGSPDVTIAVIDTGQDTHDEFTGRVVAPFNAGTLQPDATPEPFEFVGFHGVACAGLAAGGREGTYGIAGVCPDCQVMPIRLFDEEGFGSDTAVADAFTHAFDNGASVASNSWGYTFERPPDAVLDAIDLFAKEARGGLGGVILFAMGNTFGESFAFDVANDPRVLGIGGTGADDERVEYSTFGTGLDLMAPTGHEFSGERPDGPQLVTTDRPGADGANPEEDAFIDPGFIEDEDFTATMSGTSGACPLVAGVAALMLSQDPSLRYEQVFAALRASAVKVGPEPYDIDGRNDLYGFGRVDATAALDLVVLGQLCEPLPEDCQNDLDDDCDGAIDGLDEDCGFSLPVIDANVGAPCLPANQEQTCEGGFCLSPEFDREGLCSQLCTNSDCPIDTVCIDFDVVGARVCLSVCDDDDDCAEGLCSSTGAGARGCLLNCEIFPCPTSTTCQPDGRCTDGVEPPPPPPPPPPDPAEPAAEVRGPARIHITNAPSCASTSNASALLALVAITLVRRRRRGP